MCAMQKIIALDTETPYGKDLSVVDLGYWHYARDPRQVPYMISVCDGEEAWAGHPRDFNFDSLAGNIILSHNAAFDQEIAIGAIERGLWPKFSYAEWHCTANMSSYLWNVRSLAEAVKKGLGLEVDKGVRDRAKDKSWDDMVKEGWSEDMLRYARLDAQHCWTLWSKFGPLWPEWERRLSDLTIRQGRHGVAIDVNRLNNYIELMNKVIFTAINSLPWVARGRPPASPLGMAEECRAAEIPCPPVKAHDPEAAAEWEETYAPKFAWVMAVRNLRKAKKTLATLETIKLRLRPDDTVAFSLKYCGAHTKRWAGDAGWNLQNQNKEPLFVLPDFTFELNKTNIKNYAKTFDSATKAAGMSRTEVEVPGVSVVDMRGIIWARPGCKLAPTDLAQIEPRVLNWLAGNTRLLEKIASGMSIYEAFARDSMGWLGGDLKEEDKKLYQLAKIQVLGLGYGCGWNKFITIAAQYEIDITEEDEKFALQAAVDGKIHLRYREDGDWVYLSAPEKFGGLVMQEHAGVPEDTERVIFVERENQRAGEKTLQVQTVYGQQSRALVRNFRESNPLIVQLWNSMEQLLRNSVGSDLVIELPSGNSLTYRGVRRELRKFIDPETEEKIEKQCYTAEIGGRRYVLYGGLIVENVTQAIGRDVFAHNWLLCEDAGVPALFTVHDEDVPEVPAEFDSRIVTKIMSTTPAWMPGLPVGAETKDSFRYQK